VRLDDGDDDIDPFTLSPLSGLQHLVGFSDTGRCAQENL
jgi:hypothetical protein